MFKRKPRGYDEHREQEMRIVRERCEKDVCYYPRCSCDVAGGVLKPTQETRS